MFKVNMLVATNTTGQQQLGKTPTLSLNKPNCLPSSSACVKSNTNNTTSSSAPNNASISPNNLAIMSSSLDVSAPTTTANVSPPNSNNNTTGNNLKCNNTSNNNNNTSQKYDAPYGGNVTSPCNSDGNNSQNLDDTNGNNKNKSKNSNGVNLNSMDATSRGERDSLCNISSNTLIRQSSASTNSCSVQFNESSPNNGDSSSNSSNSSHMNNENNKSNDEEKLNNNQTTKNSTIIKEEERDKSNSSSSNTSSLSGNGNTNTSLPNQQASLNNIKTGLPAAIVKDEKDLVKKEEATLSPPNMSPVGFGSIVGTQINDCNENPGSTTNKSSDSSSSCDKRMVLQGNVCNDNDDSSVQQNSGGLIVPGSGANLNLINNCNALNTNNNNSLNSKSTLDGFCSDGSTSTSIGSNTPNTSCNIPINPSFIINNLSQTNGPPQGGTGGGGGGGVGNNIISGGGSGLNNCMEYMQQQNHIFVFSTQLANKGAEAVLAGQFPTIIAYHCTQPATKSFFEDFFLKNPMKMTKLQRQNTLNIMGGLPTGAGGSVSGGQPPWLTGNCNTMGKISHKLALNKSETITSSSSSSNSNAGGVLNENEMMCWNQSNSVLDSPAGDSANTMKMLENTENSSNSAKAICTGLSNDENGGIPSLQGVKVPDENLTPQQRQHREEQLAKLKKMNQFLFPENGVNDFHSQGPSNPIMAGKMQMPSEAMAASMPGNPVALMNMTGPNMGNKLNAAAMRNITGNLMNHSKAGASNTQLDNIPNLGEDIIMPADMMGGGPNEMTVIPPNIKQGCMPNINNPSLSAASGGRGLMNAGGSNLNIMNNSGSMGTMPSGNLMNDPNNAMMSNSSDVLSTFNANHCPGPNQDGNGGGMMGSHKNINAPPNHPSDINPAVGMSQMEWSKLHHHIYEERLKNNHPNNNNMPPELSGGPNGCQQTLTRCNSTGIGGAGGMTTHRSNPNANPNNRGNQGPPPPYHPTQRSASVPIATQSPNPSSPNNPTSNMSLPSPRASNTMGGAMSLTTSPSMDVTSASSASTANTNSTTTTTTAGCSNTSSGNSSSNKNTFSQQGSPTSCSASGNSNRNRSNVNSLNSNPTTPLSHVSPKDIDSKNVNTTPTPDHISSRPKSQRSRSPLLNDVPNNAMEPRFPSPGLNFAPGGTSGGNTQNLSSGFKNQSSSLEQRQNLQQMPPQFCRRTDNMPLNPNSNRSSQTKMANSFDPISSLAQMSQQLTGGSGVGLNSGGVGNSPNNMPGLMGGPVSVNDINMNGLMGGPMMGGGPLDPGMDHCNQNPNGGGGGNMGMSGLGGGPGSLAGPFGPGNCNMMAGNPGPICQRLLNPKMCAPNMSGGFNPNQVGGGMGGMRDGPAGFPGMMPTHRMMNHRMTANFGNFNVSPNIQVKASTPNTIQYMPVRPQNNNSNSNNMRVPPSLEFLQRYANPQMLVNSGAGGVGGPGVGGPVSSPADMPGLNGPSDLNKMPNSSNNMGVNPNAMNQMNFFGNCNQMSAMGGMSQPGGDPDELQGGGGMMANHDHMNIPGPHAPMLRGMRPMRQGGLQSNVGMNSAARMQHPGMGNMPPNGLVGNNPFSGNDNESLDCNDPTNNMFNNPAAANLYQQQQKNNKPPPMGMSHGPNSLNPNNSNNNSLPNTNNIINEPNPSSNPMQSSVMMGPNNTLLNTSNIPNTNNVGPNGPLSGPGNMGYKPFVGPSSNDLKYAQQYHSFQQQLYATSTRNQQPGGGQQQPPNAMSPNSNPNAGFFVNK